MSDEKDTAQAEETPEETPDVSTEASAEAPATPDDQEAVPFEVKEVTDEEGSIKRHTVEVPREFYDRKMDEVFGDLKKTVTIDGFRPGRAPLSLLKIRFGESAQDEALKDMAQDVGRQIAEKEDLDAIGDPALEDSEVPDEGPVTLKIDIEVQPKVDPEGYTGHEVEVAVPDVEDEQVDSQIEYIRESNATYETPEKPKPYAEGDGVTVDVEATDGEGNRIDDACLENAFLRDPRAALPHEVAEALKGEKPGNTIEKTVEYTHTDEEGEETKHTENFKVTIREVKERVLPELDDEFAKDLGEFETMDELRERIRKDLESQVERRRREEAMEQIFDKVLEKNPIDPPRSVVAAQQYQTFMRDTQQMQQMGVDLSALGMTPDMYMDRTRSNSARFVKINLLINAIAEKENVEVTDEDLDKAIEERAEAEGRKPLAIRARLEAERQLDNFRRQLKVNKVEELLMEQNTIKVVEPKEQDDGEVENEDEES